MEPISNDTASPTVDPSGAPGHDASEQPQRRERERSGILGEPAHIPASAGEGSDGSERSDPVHEQVPHDGVDHWRR